jgi:hypothetical protein
MQLINLAIVDKTASVFAGIKQWLENVVYIPRSTIRWEQSYVNGESSL